VALYLGLMSGTSLDGVDGVLVDFDDSAVSGPVRVLGHLHSAFDEALRAELLALNSPSDNELHRAALAGNVIARSYAQLTHRLLAAAGAVAADVQAIGAHGQTVRHQPQAFDGTGYTLQLLNGALLAEQTGIDVVCDFRSRDVAAGGQGAPLVPAFHAERFAVAGMDIAVLNLGGIANLTLLPAAGPALGFDCGPGNALMDIWCGTHLRKAFDDGGRWAASGKVQAALLATLLDEPFFARRPPKSTGRDLFNADWLQVRLAPYPAASAGDVMATLAEFTVRAAVEAIERHQPGTGRLLVCGGGAFNAHLMRRLAASCAGYPVVSTASEGLAPDRVEALAFAWLAREFKHQRAGNLPAVTGARGLRPLGALYPAELGR
jgi:anhydro-N-acetylmuramic acid kinase